MNVHFIMSGGKSKAKVKNKFASYARRKHLIAVGRPREKKHFWLNWMTFLDVLFKMWK